MHRNRVCRVGQDIRATAKRVARSTRPPNWRAQSHRPSSPHRGRKKQWASDSRNLYLLAASRSRLAGGKHAARVGVGTRVGDTVQIRAVMIQEEES